jgi:hypothetical protein
VYVGDYAQEKKIQEPLPYYILSETSFCRTESKKGGVFYCMQAAAAVVVKGKVVPVLN